MLLTLLACGVKRTPVEYGKTTVSELIAIKGEPLSEEKIPVKDSRLLEFPRNEKFQIQNDKVTHAFQDPDRGERSVLYWKHRFKDCETEIRKLEKADEHVMAEIEFACPAEGMSVIYTEGSEFVSRVIEYAKR